MTRLIITLLLAALAYWLWAALYTHWAFVPAVAAFSLAAWPVATPLEIYEKECRREAPPWTHDPPDFD